MSGHTFSNWKVAVQTPSRVDTPDGSISVSWSSNSDGGERDRKAESAARLIAGAPDMLSALQVAELALRERGLRACGEYKQIEAALAKATGGSE